MEVSKEDSSVWVKQNLLYVFKKCLQTNKQYVFYCLLIQGDFPTGASHFQYQKNKTSFGQQESKKASGCLQAVFLLALIITLDKLHDLSWNIFYNFDCKRRKKCGIP